MNDRFDAIVLGMGPGGEAAASRLLAARKRVAVVEREVEWTDALVDQRLAAVANGAAIGA